MNQMLEMQLKNVRNTLAESKALEEQLMVQLQRGVAPISATPTAAPVAAPPAAEEGPGVDPSLIALKNKLMSALLESLNMQAVLSLQSHSKQGWPGAAQFLDSPDVHPILLEVLDKWEKHKTLTGLLASEDAGPLIMKTKNVYFKFLNGGK
jgi:hypothetical protein